MGLEKWVCFLSSPYPPLVLFLGTNAIVRREKQLLQELLDAVSEEEAGSSEDAKLAQFAKQFKVSLTLCSDLPHVSLLLLLLLSYPNDISLPPISMSPFLSNFLDHLLSPTSLYIQSPHCMKIGGARIP